MASPKEQLQAADKICRKLNITIIKFSELLDKYNKRVTELNQITINFAKIFLMSKAEYNENKEIVYNLTDDDRAILAGYKKKADDTLKKEFPEFQDVWEYLKVFETNANLKDYLK